MNRDLANSIRISPLLFIALSGGGFKKDIISHAFYYARLFYSKDPVFSLLFILIQFISVGLKSNPSCEISANVHSLFLCSNF